MFFLKVATFFLVALAVGAEKKIELQDIEEDNLRNEMRAETEKEIDKSDSPKIPESVTGPGFSTLGLMKNGITKYYDNFLPQQQRYVHQYAVTEPPEREPPANKAHYRLPTSQQAMVGYLSNFPMQIYLVPQHYPEHSGQTSPRVVYQGAPEEVQRQSNYLDVPPYVPPTGKPNIQHYSTPQAVSYVTFPNQPHPTQSTAPTPATPPPAVAYHIPVIFQYNPQHATSTNSPQAFYANPHYVDTNVLDELQEHDQKPYSTQTEMPFYEPSTSEFPRHYNSHAPIREDYGHHTISELPRPNPLLLNPSPPHLSHLPKTLPTYRIQKKPSQGLQVGGLVNSFTARPHDHFPPLHFKRRPLSLLDSYIPSSLQLEYVKRGLVKDTASAYEALSSGRLANLIPQQHYERGFLPNQMYHTANGGITYGHYKRSPKVDKSQHK